MYILDGLSIQTPIFLISPDPKWTEIDSPSIVAKSFVSYFSKTGGIVDFRNTGIQTST